MENEMFGKHQNNNLEINRICGKHTQRANWFLHIGESNNLGRRKNNQDVDLRYKRIDRQALAKHADNHPLSKIITDSVALLH